MSLESAQMTCGRQGGKPQKTFCPGNCRQGSSRWGVRDANTRNITHHWHFIIYTDWLMTGCFSDSLYCSITPFYILDNQGFNHPTISHLAAPSLVSTLGQCMHPEHQWLTPLPVWTLPVCDDQSYRCRHDSFSSPGHLNPTLSFTILDYLRCA